MKKSIYFLMAVGAITSCASGGKSVADEPRELDSIIEKCPQATDIYKHHNYKIDINYVDVDGWSKEKCEYCGLEYLFSTNLTSDVHYGTIDKFKTPSTGQFDDWRITYIDDTGTHHIKITEADTRPIDSTEVDVVDTTYTGVE